MIHLEFARDRSISPRFVFAGRLVQEKWFDLVIDVAKEFLSHQKYRGLLEIYGDGPLRWSLISELSDFSGFFDASKGEAIPPGAQVVYFGQVEGRRVTEAFARSHYLLMPSRFLETFWLSALEAIESGVPVIGFDQWGLRQFLLSEHRVLPDFSQRDIFLRAVIDVDSTFSWANWRRQSLSVQDIAKKFSKDIWWQEMRKILSPSIKKILIISDYSAQIWGIETHINGCIEMLKRHDFTVDSLYWMRGHNRIMRYLWLLFSWGNVIYMIGLWVKLYVFRPDAVWIHSEVRCIGPLGLLPLLKYRGTIIKTYHDLGYFWAFPTQFTSESSLRRKMSFSQFYAISRGLHRYFFVHILAKYWQIQAIRSIVGIRGIHIAPSEFMIPAVEDFVSHEAVVAQVSHFSPHQA